MRNVYVAYVMSLDHQVKVLAGSQPSEEDALAAAESYIREHPQDWQEFDRLVVVRELTSIPVDLIVLGA